MIIDKYFVFLHVPKTGGTWVRNVLRNRSTFIHEFKDHRFTIPLEHEGKPVFTFVRNPWDLYVSTYTHFHHNWEKKQHEFDFRKLNKRKLTESENFLENRFGGTFEDMLLHQEAKNDFISKTYKVLPNNPTVLRYEDGLALALMRFFETVGIPYQENDIKKFQTSRFNCHQQYRNENTKYSDALNQLILRYDDFVISRWDYEIPQALIKQT